MTLQKDRKIKAKECRFALHIPTRQNEVADVHLIKECVHYEDGTHESKIRFIKDYQRPFWITRPSCRNHQSKKEWEKIENLDEFKCTQSELRYRVAQKLGKAWSRESLKVLSQSPYLYGTDITSSALIKNEYKTKWPNTVTGYTSAVYDIETDVRYGTGEIIMASLIFENKIFTVITEQTAQGYPDIRLIATNKYNSLLKKYIDENQLEFEIQVVKTPALAVIEIFKKANEWQPDFMAIWNMDFDIPKSLEAVVKEGYDPAQVLSHPSVDPLYRRCEYKQGNKKKITASGRVIPINPSSQWHTLYLTAAFYVIDAMCTYKLLRSPPAQEEPSYSLDAILNKEMNFGKLRFEQADQYTGLQWHEIMQTRYIPEYIVYNIFDCLGIVLMNEKTKDLSFSMPGFAGTTDFEKFNSNPRKIHDALHYFCLERGLVISSSGASFKNVAENSEEPYEIDFTESEDNGEEKEEEYDTLGLKGWIVTLPAHLMANLGIPVIAEDPNLRPNIRGYCFDSDSVSAYPSATIACNVSKETTRKEISSVEGIDETTFRLQNINLIYGNNSVEYCTEMMGFPALDELEELIAGPSIPKIDPNKL
jgi:hypothetical protein